MATVTALPDRRRSFWNPAAAHRQVLEWSLLLLVATFPLKSIVDLDAIVEVGSVPLLSLPKLAGALFFSLFLLYALLHRPTLWVDKTHALLLGFIGIAIASSLQASVQSTAVITTARYASFIALYFAMVQLLTEPRTRAWVIWALVAACAVTASIALANMISRNALIAKTPYGDANDVAFMLATVVPLGCWLAGWQGRIRLLVLAMASVIALGVVLSFSRSALVGLAAAGIWLVLAERRRARMILVGVAFAVLLAALLVWLDPVQLREAIAAKQKVAWVNITNRIMVWQAAVQLVLEHPLLGVGPGNFQFYYAEVWLARPGAHELRVVHNSYLEIACEMGLVALALFGAFLAIIFTRLAAVVRRGGGDAGLAMALRASLVVALVGGVFVSEQLFAPYWLIAGIGNAVWLSVRRRHAEA